MPYRCSSCKLQFPRTDSSEMPRWRGIRKGDPHLGCVRCLTWCFGPGLVLKRADQVSPTHSQQTIVRTTTAKFHWVQWWDNCSLEGWGKLPPRCSFVNFLNNLVSWPRERSFLIKGGNPRYMISLRLQINIHKWNIYPQPQVPSCSPRFRYRKSLDNFSNPD